MGCNSIKEGIPTNHSIELMGGLAQLGIYAQLAERPKTQGGEGLPPSDQQRALRFWLWSRSQSYDQFLKREIARVHCADEKNRPSIEVECSDGPAWVEDHAWVSPREQALKRQQDRLKREFPFVRSGPLSSGSPLDGKWSQLMQRLPGYYSLELAQSVQVLRRKL